MEDDTLNLIGVHRRLGYIMVRAKIEGFLIRISNIITRRVSSSTD